MRICFSGNSKLLLVLAAESSLLQGIPQSLFAVRMSKALCKPTGKATMTASHLPGLSALANRTSQTASNSKPGATTPTTANSGGKEKRSHSTSTSRVAPYNPKYSLCNRVERTRKTSENQPDGFETSPLSPQVEEHSQAAEQFPQSLPNRRLTAARNQHSDESSSTSSGRDSSSHMSSARRSSGTSRVASSTTRSSGTSRVAQPSIASLEAKVDLLLTKVEKLSKTVGKLSHSIKEMEKRTFSIESSPYKNELWVKCAEVYCTTLTRNIKDSSLAKIVTSVFGQESEKYMQESAIQFMRKKISQWKSDERRKIVGLPPFKEFAILSTKTLADKIIHSMRAPQRVDQTYARNLAALRYFIRNEGDKKGVHRLFEDWVGEDGIDQRTWSIIMDQDKEAHPDPGGDEYVMDSEEEEQEY